MIKRLRNKFKVRVPPLSPPDAIRCNANDKEYRILTTKIQGQPKLLKPPKSIAFDPLSKEVPPESEGVAYKETSAKRREPQPLRELLSQAFTLFQIGQCPILPSRSPPRRPPCCLLQPMVSSYYPPKQKSTPPAPPFFKALKSPRGGS